MANSYDSSREPLKSDNARAAGPARDWYALQNTHIGAKELPKYGRGMYLRIGTSGTVGTPPVTLVVVPIDETDDSATRTLVRDQSEYIPYAVRRIVSVNGGATLPTGVSIDIFTK